MGDRTITVKENGKIVYEGPEQRHSQSVAVVQQAKFFGLSPDTWIKIGGFLIAVVLFYARTDDFMKSQAKTNDYLVNFTKNSDGYHSAQTGLQFEQGQPNGRTISSTRRNNFNSTQSARTADNQGD